MNMRDTVYFQNSGAIVNCVVITNFNEFSGKFKFWRRSGNTKTLLRSQLLLQNVSKRHHLLYASFTVQNVNKTDHALYIGCSEKNFFHL